MTEGLLVGAALYLLIGSVVAAVTGKLSVRAWLYQLFITVDQTANVLLAPFHSGTWADETMSSRAWRMEQERKPWGRLMRPVIDWLFRWQVPNHCEQAYEKERARAHVPPEMR